MHYFYGVFVFEEFAVIGLRAAAPGQAMAKEEAQGQELGDAAARPWHQRVIGDAQ